MDRFQVVVDPALAPIMDRYMELRRVELGQLEAALESGDGKAVMGLGHKLKGTGSSYGLDRLTELGAAIEEAGSDRKLDVARGLIRAVRDFIEHVDIVYGE